MNFEINYTKNYCCCRCMNQLEYKNKCNKCFLKKDFFFFFVNEKRLIKYSKKSYFALLTVVYLYIYRVIIL